MRRIVTALFFDPAYPADDDYVRRRHESSTRPARGRRSRRRGSAGPGETPPPTPSTERAYDRITVPTLVIEGAGTSCCPPGWAADIAGQIAGARSAVVDAAGHCPQIEQPDVVNDLLLRVSRRDVYVMSKNWQARSRSSPAARRASAAASSSGSSPRAPRS